VSRRRNGTRRASPTSSAAPSPRRSVSLPNVSRAMCPRRPTIACAPASAISSSCPAAAWECSVRLQGCRPQFGCCASEIRDGGGYALARLTVCRSTSARRDEAFELAQRLQPQFHRTEALGLLELGCGAEDHAQRNLRRPVLILERGPGVGMFRPVLAP